MGCMDSEALNYNAEATINEGCVYPTNNGTQDDSNSTQDVENNTNTDSNQTNETLEPTPNNLTASNQSNLEENKTCEGCCGDAFEVAAGEECPMFSCDPCEQNETSDSKSSVVTLARSLLFAAIGVAALVLIFSGRRGGEGDLSLIHI